MHHPFSRSLRRLAVLLASGLGFGAVGPAQAAPPTYRVTDLGMPEGQIYMRGSALSERGEVIGYSFGKRIGVRFFTWTQASGLKSWHEPFKHPGIALNDLNRSHQVVGDIYHDSDANHSQTGFVWDRSTGTQPLDGLIEGHVNSSMAALNEQGVATGWYTSNLHPHTRTFVWSAETGVVDIHPSGYAMSTPLALNNRGQVLVSAYETGRSDREIVVLSKGGGATPFACVPLAGQPSTSCIGTSINDRGLVAGEVQGTKDVDGHFWPPVHPIVWSPAGEAVDISAGTPFADYWADFLDINQQGQVVGRLQQTHFDDFETFYWDAENGMHRLEDLVDPADPLKGRFEATGQRPKINSQGEILLNVSFDHNASHQHVLVLTPAR